MSKVTKSQPMHRLNDRRMTKTFWMVLAACSLIAGAIATVCSAGHQNFYTISDCRESITEGNVFPAIPQPFNSCTGYTEGAPKRFISSSVDISSKYKAKPPITIDKLDAFAELRWNVAALVYDWLVWSCAAFVVISMVCLLF